MKMRASYNNRRLGCPSGLIIADMKMRASYNWQITLVFFPGDYSRYENESKL